MNVPIRGAESRSVLAVSRTEMLEIKLQELEELMSLQLRRCAAILQI